MRVGLGVPDGTQRVEHLDRDEAPERLLHALVDPPYATAGNDGLQAIPPRDGRPDEAVCCIPAGRALCHRVRAITAEA
ncbi:MAG: hypothetical protein AMXMBFR64_30790 [Myxococcales bacterium]